MTRLNSIVATMALPDMKPVLAALHSLLRMCTQSICHYVIVLSNAPLVLATAAWLARLQERPWFRKSRNAFLHVAAFIIGSTYEDERVAFSATRLVTNDAYRDRLLVPEIADLVVLSDALQLSLPQRKAYFQCFLHVDCMRRSTVSRDELLRYCNLRATPLSFFLLPSTKMPTHRAVGRHRWDVLQLLAACFSVCTADLEHLVRLAVAEACRAEKEGRGDDTPNSQLDESPGDQPEKPHAGRSRITTTGDICQQIDCCLRFFMGVPDASEVSLQRLLTALYGDITENNELEEATSATPSPRHNFQEIHSVTSLLDVARLFPVLIFPCIWVHRVLRLRILGARTWQCLQRRRHELQPHAPASSLFLSVSDIIAALQTHLHQKNGSDKDFPGTNGKSEAMESARSDGSGNSRTSASRKIVPCVVDPSNQERPSVEKGEGLNALPPRPTSDAAGFEQFLTLEDAWRTTANHALASIHVQCAYDNTSMAGEEELKMEFQRVAKDITAGQLGTKQCERIRHRLVRDYGYRFAQFLLAKSSVKEKSPASQTPAQERRAQQRYSKAWNGDALVEDKGIYWKQLRDPVAKREFYYNARTGESRWEKPATFVSRTAKKKKKRRRKKPTPQEHPNDTTQQTLVGDTAKAPASVQHVSP